jgi:type IV pilus assembly protein PilA
MEKKMNNKGFSLVELIIVVAIMAVLIGVLAPAYLQYVEKSKKTSDCTALGSAMDAMEICAADPALDWKDETITVTIGSSGVAFTVPAGKCATTKTQLESIIESGDGEVQGNWTGDLSVQGTKDENGKVNFALPASGAVSITDIEKISPALAKRIE